MSLLYKNSNNNCYIVLDVLLSLAKFKIWDKIYMTYYYGAVYALFGVFVSS